MNRLAFMIVVLFAAPLAAQQPGAANKEAMKKLEFLAGKWKGDATVSINPKETKLVKHSEEILFKLDGTVLLVEGTGRGKLQGKEEEGILFQAMGVMSYDAEAKKYKIKAYRSEGVSVDADVTVSEKGFIWGFKEPKRGVEVKYTMTLTPKGEWHEIGEYSLDGKTWTKIIEMTLTRVKE